MAAQHPNSFKARKTLKVGPKSYTYWSLSAVEKEVGDLEMVVDHRPGECGIQNLLHPNLAPFRFPRMYACGGSVIRDVAKCRLALRIEPRSHAGEVPVSGCVWEIVGHRPDAQQYRKHMGLHVRERELNGL